MVIIPAKIAMKIHNLLALLDTHGGSIAILCENEGMRAQVDLLLIRDGFLNFQISKRERIRKFVSEWKPNGKDSLVVEGERLNEYELLVTDAIKLLGGLAKLNMQFEYRSRNLPSLAYAHFTYNPEGNTIQAICMLSNGAGFTIAGPHDGCYDYSAVVDDIIYRSGHPFPCEHVTVGCATHILRHFKCLFYVSPHSKVTIQDGSYLEMACASCDSKTNVPRKAR